MANAPFDPFGDRNNDFDDEVSKVVQDILRELKNTTDIVGDAVRLSKDELLRSVGESVRSVRSAAKDARDRYAEEIKNAQAAQPRQTQPPKSGNAQKGRKKLRAVSKGANLLMVPVVMLLTASAVLFIIALSKLLLHTPDPVFSILGVSLTLAACFPLTFSLRKKHREKLYTRYLETVGTASSVALRPLAAKMKRKLDKCVSDLRDMLSRGYFPENAHLDIAAGELIINAEAAQAEKSRMEQQRREQEKAAKETASDSYEAMLTELQQLNVLIEDEDMSEMITRIETVARATFLAVRQKPEKASQLRRFMDYYLPTTIKLLRSYAGFEHSTVQGKNILRSQENIEDMMKTLCEAFEKQYDSLFLSETLDINAEIKTMDRLLRQDGYVGGGDFDSAAAKQEKAL